MSNDFSFGPSGGNTTDFNFTTPASSEKTLDFTFGENVYIYKILKGSTNNFNSIWCDPKASLYNNLFYVSRKDDLSIIETIDKQAVLKRYYNQSSEESLQKDTIVDINVTY